MSAQSTGGKRRGSLFKIPPRKREVEGQNKITAARLKKGDQSLEEALYFFLWRNSDVVHVADLIIQARLLKATRLPCPLFFA